MNEEEKILWNKILNFNIDDPDSSFTFTDRLCRENDWRMEYALRTIIEYKKFIFLICISDSAQTPSDQVDQVWHLHLLYTQSYWKEFCKELLNTEIHHGPTKGWEERGFFKDQYATTLTYYIQKFKEKPPIDIWPTPQKRISEINFSRVNRHRNWIIPKIKFN
ncbi:glycine-rich domain-containing protein [Crocinitomix catalasitica]|uniref:glycine-rich domain-containing protein n=1 Tax=Crocinitomix catalasitica TaxID=184607 RepID=UPI0004845740|nr:hypothetical protein [Crocinitomix catalasitica]|tara:strand:- start:291 stop:779 length:489 start_codon:yes stop_codon:yes gene_type:complete